MSELLKVEGICRTFGSVTAVDDVSLHLAPKEIVAILGRSGSGKSTLLNLLVGLEGADRGRICYRGQDIVPMNEEQLALWRRKEVGLVFQNFNLIQTLSALENVAFPLYPEKMSTAERRKRALAALEQVGLAHRADHRPTQLSGGEQQRVAIARALIQNPPLIFADEPTGNLDSKTGDEILKLFQRLRDENGVALLIITHDENKVASIADRVIRMADGRIVEDAAANQAVSQ